mgnify:FL=1
MSLASTDPLPRFKAEPGHLYLVSTPIGNLADLSFRARDILSSVDRIACEDTRVTARLLQRFGVEKTLISYREENEKTLAPGLADAIAGGESLALVADAGTPTLSDPGYRLVRACRSAGLPVVPVPGPFAAITALAASGLPTDGFLYVGFLPPKRSARQRFFREHEDFPYTLVCYESTHRIEKFLADANECLGPERLICLARELTKRHETFLVGTLEGVCSRFQQSSHKGEFVVCIGRKGLEW